MSSTSLYDATYQEGASSLDQGYTRTTDHLNEAIFDSHPSRSLLNSYQAVAFEDFSYPIQNTEQIWNDPIQQSSPFNPTFGKEQTYVPEYGHPSLGVGSAAVPGFGIFPPGGWILALNEATPSEEEEETGGMGGPPGGAKGPQKP
jgi:hypothetical protein